MHLTTLLTLLLLARSADALSNLHEKLTHYEVGTIGRRRLSKRSVNDESDSQRVYDLYLQTDASRCALLSLASTDKSSTTRAGTTWSCRRSNRKQLLLVLSDNLFIRFHHPKMTCILEPGLYNTCKIWATDFTDSEVINIEKCHIRITK